MGDAEGPCKMPDFWPREAPGENREGQTSQKVALSGNVWISKWEMAHWEPARSGCGGQQRRKNPGALPASGGAQASGTTAPDSQEQHWRLQTAEPHLTDPEGEGTHLHFCTQTVWR